VIEALSTMRGLHQAQRRSCFCGGHLQVAILGSILSWACSRRLQVAISGSILSWACSGRLQVAILGSIPSWACSGRLQVAISGSILSWACSGRLLPARRRGEAGAFSCFFFVLASLQAGLAFLPPL